MPISVKSPRSLAGVAPALRALVAAAIAQAGRKAGEVGIALADDALLRALNRDFRGLDKATDVLSFGYDETGELSGAPGAAAEPTRLPKPSEAKQAARAKVPAPRKPVALVNGDLVISMDRVREQAKRYKVTEGEELARLAIHGALHLAGLDHQHDAERRAMRAEEDAVMKTCAAQVRALSKAMRAPRK